MNISFPTEFRIIFLPKYMAALCLAVLAGVALCFLSISHVLIAIITILGVFLALRRIEILIFVYIALAAILGKNDIFVVQGKNVAAGGANFAFAFMGFLTIMWALKIIVFKDRKSRLEPTPLNIPLIGMIGAASLSVLSSYFFWDPMVPNAHRYFIIQLSGITLFALSAFAVFIIVNTFKTEVMIKRAYMLMIVLATPAVLNVMGLVKGFGWSYTFLVTIAPVCFAHLLYEKSVLKRLFLLTIVVSSLLFGLFIIKFTMIVMSVGAILTISFIKSRKFFVGVICILIISYFVASATIGTSLWDIGIEKAVKVNDFGRFQTWRSVIEFWKRNPLFGVGVGNGRSYLEAYKRVYTGFATSSPHSQYFNLLFDTGLVGIFFFFWLIISALRYGYKLYKSAEIKYAKILTLGWIGAFVGLLGGSVFSDVLYPSINNDGINLFRGTVYPWIIMGLAISAGRLNQSGETI